MDQANLCNPCQAVARGPLEPVLWQTKLGKTIFGATDTRALDKPSRTAFTCGRAHTETCSDFLPVWKDVARVWEDEKWPKPCALTAEEEAAVKVFYETRKKVGDRYQVSPLWKRVK